MITLHQFRQFIQSKEEEALGIITPPTYYYLRMFEIYGKKKFFLSWNWAAFFTTLFFGHLWFAYRGMYTLAAIFWLVSNGLFIGLVLFCTQILPQYISLPNPAFFPKIGYGLATMFLTNFMGVFANTIYFAFTRHSIAKGKQKGGTNLMAAVLALLIGILILSIIRKYGLLHL